MDRLATSEHEFMRAALTHFAARADSIVLYGDPRRNRLPVFAFNMLGYDGTALSRAFDTVGIESRAGDYYTPRLMHRLAPDFNNSAVRLSFAHYNTLDDLDRCFAAIDRMIAGRGELTRA